MKKKLLLLLIFGGMIFGFGSFGYAAPFVDIIQTPTDYFVPTDAQKYDDPYYRWYNEDWGWTHNPIPVPFTTATLRISAFDVDWYESESGEHDLIYAWDNTNTKTLLGELDGATDIWDYTDFPLDLTQFGTAISGGLQVFIDIDSTHTYDNWAVTLAKSVLSVDGGEIPGANPGGVVPEPATMLLLGSGLIGLAEFARRRFKK
jgi:hypothetical protein